MTPSPAALHPSAGERQEDQRPGARHDRHRHRQGRGDEVGDEQHAEQRERGSEHQRIADGFAWRFELIHRVPHRHVAPEVPPQHRQRRGERDEVDRHHHGGVAAEADAEVVGADDVDEVRDHQRQAGAVGDEPAGDDEGHSRRWLELEAEQDRQHDRRQQQGRAVIGEDGGDRGPEQHHQREQPPPCRRPSERCAAPPSGRSRLRRAPAR